MPAPSNPAIDHTVTRWTEEDIYFFKEGTHYRLFEKMGAHPMKKGRKEGVYFSVWAPNANYVSVIGDFNGWDDGAHPLKAREDGSGIWEGFIPSVASGDHYKYHIASNFHGVVVHKSDPYGFLWEAPPKSATRVWNSEYTWEDAKWMKERGKHNSFQAPISVYEMHLGSWRRVPEEENRWLTYRELAEQLPEYLNTMGFTHVEFLPPTEHPFAGSWGYQAIGYFAPTSRFGTPEDFMYLVDRLHQAEIGVLIDWVPSHFVVDAHGLANFDGTSLYEHQDSRQGYHPDWGSAIFNFDRNEVRAFLISSAVFWMEKYHIDGIRVDAVASMLYLDYSRKEGEWIPNKYGGNENLGAIDFLRRFNETIYGMFPDTFTVAEESTAWPMVSQPTYLGGLGFGMKWNMGWMHDTLEYFSKEPVHRKYHHDDVTFSLIYAFNENFMLPLSHDEVVHMKGSLIRKMPGDEWQRFANLRALYGFMFTHPGKKLLFMGAELAQYSEWNYQESLDWHLLQYGFHHGIQRLLMDLNRLYRQEPSLYLMDAKPEGFRWVGLHDYEQSVLSYLRLAPDSTPILVVCNFTPVPRHFYRLGVPRSGFWKEILNTDAAVYGGGNIGNAGGVWSEPEHWQEWEHSVSLTLPPLAVAVFRWEQDA